MTPAPERTSTFVAGLAVTRRRSPEVGGSTPTVVLVHGAMDRAASFSRAMRRLADLDVVAYDRRGYAGSAGAGVAADLAAHAGDLADVIDWTGASSVVVVGHSLGGTVAAELAVRGSSAMVALATFESPFPLLDDSFDEVGGGAVQVGVEQGPGAGAEFFYRLVVGEQTWSRLRERDREARRAEGAALMAELTALRDPDRALDPADIDLPVLVGMGGLSSQRMRSSARLLSQRAPRAQLDEIPLGGHGAHLTHPDDFARYCRDAVALARTPPIGAEGS